MAVEEAVAPEDVAEAEVLPELDDFAVPEAEVDALAAACPDVAVAFPDAAVAVTAPVVDAAAVDESVALGKTRVPLDPPR